MKSTLTLCCFVFLQLSSIAQLKITSTEKLPLDNSHQWSAPQFSPDGKNVYYTTFDYQGIWAYSLAKKTASLVTDDPRSGYGFCLSPDGKKIAYRRTMNEKDPRGRTQEIVVKELTSNSSEVLASGSNLSTPSFAGTTVIYSENVTTKNLTANVGTQQPIVLGIENTKILLVEAGDRQLLDPLKNGSYIWPMLSPDGKRIVASDMAKGTFVCDLRGNNLVRLGKRNAAVWSRDGKWLIYMNDKDDGHNIVSSDLFSISPDGKRETQLTSTKNEIELYPQCSPTENKIICNTLDGEILVFTYQEAKR